jgi:hypothetical protein
MINVMINVMINFMISGPLIVATCIAICRTMLHGTSRSSTVMRESADKFRSLA